MPANAEDAVFRIRFGYPAAVDEMARFVYVETIGNPTLGVADIEKYAEVAHRHGIPLVVDATFSTPILEHPIRWGADVVIHSLSKWIGGHGAGIGGVVIDGGNFDWTQKGNPLYVDPDTGYHGIRWGEAIGKLAFITQLANVGDARSLVIHPASSTHSQLTEREQIDAGLRPELIRLSIGIEHIDDIIADLDQALARV